MKRKLWIVMALTFALTAMGAAHAQTESRPMRGGRADGERYSPQQQSGQAVREMLRREMPPAAGPNRMNAEERRQLRRDIHEAGQELYRGNAQRPQR